MKLTLKMSVFLIIGILVIMVLDGYISIHQDLHLFKNSVEQRMMLLGRALRMPILDIWRTSGQEKALKLIEDVNQSEEQIIVRWVWDGKPGRYGSSASGDQPSIEKLETRGDAVFFRETDPATNAVFLVGHIPVLTPSGQKGWIELVENMKDTRYHTWQIIKKTSIVLALTIVLYGLFVLFGGFFIIGRRLNILKQKALRIGQGDMEGAVNVGGRDELSDLGNTINQMSVSLKTAIEERKRETEARLVAIDQLHHADRLKTIGTLASGIAHEIGTPVTVVSGRAGIIMSGHLSTEDISKNAAIIKDQANRITSLIKQLLDFARIDSVPRKRVDLRGIVRQSVELMMPMLKKGLVEVNIEIPEDPVYTSINVVKIQQVISNLITNAIQSMPGGGVIGIETGSGPPPDTDKTKTRQEMAYVSITDGGSGIADDVMSRLFDPFFSTKESGKGTGLGLSIVQSIVREHNGWVDVRSEVGRGSCFTVYLPKESKNER